MRPLLAMVAAALLVACCGVGWVGAGEALPQEASGTESASLSPSDSTAEAVPAARQGQDSSAADRVVVTYFHRTFRCEMCLAFEADSEEALRTSFPDELADGRLVWSALNLDDEENAHYEDEYGLTDLSLVVALERAGHVVDWRSLPDIWGLVDDKQAFVSYVSYEVGKSLKELAAYGRAQGDSADPLPLHGKLVPESDGGGVDAGAPE